MPFSEKIKKEVKEAAAFQCCRCQSISVEVHHIIPEADKGPSDFDNAAPLCSTCHSDFGDNPKKCKEIRQMRDWWYQQVKNRFKDRVFLAEIKKIHSELELIKKQQNTDLNDLKSELKTMSDRLIDNITPSTASDVASGILGTASLSTSVSPFTSFSLTPLDTRYLKISGDSCIDKTCLACGTKISPFIPYNTCPNCGVKISK